MGRYATVEDFNRSGIFPGTYIPELPNNSTAQTAYNTFMQYAGKGNEVRAEQEIKRAGNDFRSKFKEIVGRDASDQEFNRFFEDVLSNVDVGLVSRPNDLRPILNSYVADTYGGLAEGERKKALETKASGSYDTVANIFKGTLGRDPSEQEKKHFARLMAENDADEYELGEALKMLPEYQEKADLSAREKLRGELSTADTDFFQKSVLPSIQSRFAQQGRSVEGSSFAAAAANAAKDISGERERYLAGLGREDYALRRQQAIHSYLGNLSQQQADQAYTRARGDQLSDMYRQRAYDLNDYDRQARVYEEYLRNNGRRKSTGGLFGGAGGLVGMGLGALLAAPTGGMSIPMGASLGGMLGGTGGSLFDK